MLQQIKITAKGSESHIINYSSFLHSYMKSVSLKEEVYGVKSAYASTSGSLNYLFRP